MLPSQAVALICVSAIFPSLALVAVILRVRARQVTGTRFNTSDYFIFFTLVDHQQVSPAYALLMRYKLNAVPNAIACIIGAVACGIGLPLTQLTGYLEVRFLKVCATIACGRPC